MFGILGLGFLLGMQHALEADHIAAVSSIAARRSQVGDIVRHGLTWGLGHTLTLFVFAGAALLLGHAIPESLARPIEAAVGVMLVGLGAHVLWRLWRDRVHFHRHGHGDGTVHFHAHSHAGEAVPHDANPHRHEHRLPLRSVAVGMIHGMAGSAALALLASQAMPGPALMLAYIVVFGAGSIAGMALLSGALAIPLCLTARHLTRVYRMLNITVALFSIGLGSRLLLALGG